MRPGNAISRDIARLSQPRLATAADGRAGMPETTATAHGQPDVIARATRGRWAAAGANADNPNLIATGGLHS